MKTDPTILNARPLKRPGIDHDPVASWVWGDTLTGVVQVVSYAVPATSSGVIDGDATLMVRTVPGDPSTLREVKLSSVACFERSRHEWDQRPMYVWDEGTEAFYFVDDGKHGHPDLADRANRNKPKTRIHCTYPNCECTPQPGRLHTTGGDKSWCPKTGKVVG